MPPKSRRQKQASRAGQASAAAKRYKVDGEPDNEFDENELMDGDEDEEEPEAEGEEGLPQANGTSQHPSAVGNGVANGAPAAADAAPEPAPAAVPVTAEAVSVKTEPPAATNEVPVKQEPVALAAAPSADPAPADAAPAPAAAAPAPALAAAKPAPKPVGRPAAAPKDSGPTRRSNRAGKKVDYGALNAMGHKAVDYTALNGLPEDETDEEDLLPAYDGSDAGSTRRSSRTRTGRKVSQVLDYSMMGKRIGGEDDRYRDDRDYKSKKESISMRHKYESIFPNGYRSDVEDFDYWGEHKRHSKRERHYDDDDGNYGLRRKRGKYDIARSVLGDETTDSELDDM